VHAKTGWIRGASALSGVLRLKDGGLRLFAILMRYDSKLDGEVTGKPADAVRWALTVRNDRISGSLADMKPGDPKDHRVAGEIVAGKPPIMLLRQDGPNGLVCYYTGRRVEAEKVVGTWFDNRGSAGDFEMTMEKK